MPLSGCAPDICRVSYGGSVYRMDGDTTVDALRRGIDEGLTEGSTKAGTPCLRFIDSKLSTSRVYRTASPIDRPL